MPTLSVTCVVPPPNVFSFDGDEYIYDVSYNTTYVPFVATATDVGVNPPVVMTPSAQNINTRASLWLGPLPYSQSAHRFS